MTPLIQRLVACLAIAAFALPGAGALPINVPLLGIESSGNLSFYATRGAVGGQTSPDIGPPCTFAMGQGIADVEVLIGDRNATTTILVQAPVCGLLAVVVCEASLRADGGWGGPCVGNGTAHSVHNVKFGPLLGVGPADQVAFDFSVSGRGACVLGIGCSYVARGHANGFAAHTTPLTVSPGDPSASAEAALDTGAGVSAEASAGATIHTPPPGQIGGGAEYSCSALVFTDSGPIGVVCW